MPGPKFSHASGPSMYSDSLAISYMDYDNPQFIAAIRRILGRYLQPDIDRISPEGAPTQEGGQPPINPSLGPDVNLPPEHENSAPHCRPDQTPTAKYVLEVLAAGILSAYTVAAILQLGAMRGQLAQMQGSGKQTDQLICLYRQQLLELQKQAAHTHQLAAQAKKQAEAALAANIQTREIFLAESRPWLEFVPQY